MESLHIKNFEAHYHLPPSQLSLRERLDRLLDEVLDGALELTLEHMGISARHEICIRKIHIPVRLAMSSPDQSVVMNWSQAIAENIQNIISHNDPRNVIRYSSRLHGLIDFAIGVATADYYRAWAWHQLGFIHERRIDTNEAAAVALTTALQHEAVWIIPVLKTVAQINVFHLLVNRIPNKGWIDLAMGALAAYDVVLEPSAIGDAPDPALSLSNDAILSAAASRIVSQSAFTATLREHPRQWAVSGIPPWVVAVFAILDAEPAMLRRSYHETKSLVQHTASALQAIVKAAEPVVSLRQSPSSQTDVVDHDRTAMKLSKASDGNQAHNGMATPSYSGENDHGRLRHRLNHVDSLKSHRVETRSDPIDGQVDDDFEGLSPRDLDPSNWRESGSSGRLDLNRIESGYPELAVTHHRAQDNYEILEEQERILPDTRRTGYTDVGGLMFLLPLIDQIGIVDEIVSKCVFKNRPLRWVLHRLAINLTRVDEHDAGVLAFCGLRPDDEFPWMNEPEPNAEELELFVGWIERIVQSLRVRLQWLEKSDEKILHLVCHRRARIEADPGWIEAVFSLKDVSTDIRRAALDLDPGFLPWLGVAIKFIYE